LTIEAKLKYRKFDNEYLRFIQQEEFDGNDLPVTIMATDRVVLPIAGGPTLSHDSASAVAEWERWNDYGIGLLREGNSGASKGELRQAEQVFTRVETMNPGQGALNLARVYFKEGRLDEASAAIHRAAQASPAAPPWTLAWFSARIDHENGYLDNAIASLERIVANQFEDARTRGFDFSYDVNLLNELGRTHFERARMERGSKRSEQRQRFLQKSRAWFKSTLQIDPENQTAHYNLALVYAELGESDLAIHHRQLHERYRPDDHAIEVAVTRHRQNNPAADHAASAFAIYDLNRPQAYGMDTSAAPAVAQSASSYEQE
jgi:tetratricopeptide (TPR) repeat protein